MEEDRREVDARAAAAVQERGEEVGALSQRAAEAEGALSRPFCKSHTAGAVLEILALFNSTPRSCMPGVIF